MVASEPAIAANHSRTAAARTLAESGLERAIWALTEGPTGGGIGAPAPNATAPAPYDGSAALALPRTGTFVVTVTGIAADRARVTATGTMLVGSAARARQRIEAEVMTLTDFAAAAPCALCVNGDVVLDRGTLVDARASFASACGGKYAVYSSGDTRLNRGTVYGGDGGTTANQPNKKGIDYVEDQTGFGGFALSDAQLAALRTVAQAQGHYHRGQVIFDASNPLPASGVVFVDTVDGATVTANTSGANLASVILGADARPAGAAFHGWLVVNGDLTLRAGFNAFTGVGYAVNRLASGDLDPTDLVTGLLVGAERRGDRGTAFRARDLRLVYDCATVQSAGSLPRGWFVVPGTYRELPG
jgi:hypothetical protein